MSINYYYILTCNPYKIEITEYLDELILLLYEGKADFISEIQCKELNLPKDYLKELKKIISNYEDRLPLYDIRYNHIFLIYKDNIFARIFFDNYRFIDQNFFNDLKKIKNPDKIDLENLRILSHYDIEMLNNTYLKIFYRSFVLHSYITNCKRPSFYSGMEHILPYYSINELHFLAYDWNLTKKTTLTEDDINKYCKEISKHDIPAKTLLDHQIYIYDSNSVGLVKHYSLFGSYYMNIYLRKNKCCLLNDVAEQETIRNLYLENQIKLMIKLIINSPIFIKSHSVYRFIENDSFLKHLKKGDIYQDISFMSTTRNPFYYKENYSFGVILLKIKLPKNIKGIGLCIESFSNFPKEEEIILPPTSKYRLDNVIDAEKATEFLNIFKLDVQKKYEFTWISNDFLSNQKKIKINIPNGYVSRN